MKQKARVKKYTLTELRKMGKSRLIRIILNLQKRLLSKKITRRAKSKSGSKSKPRKLSAGIHIITLKNGQKRKVKVLASGKWKFLKMSSKDKKKSGKSKKNKRR